MTDTVLAALGLALRGGNLAVGEEPVAEACRTGKARVVLLASDAAGNTARRATRLAGENVPLVLLPRDKSQVGFALGRASCAVAAVTEPGLAALVLSRLAEEEKARYGQVAALLEGRARQAREKSGRQKAQTLRTRPGRSGEESETWKCELGGGLFEPCEI